MKILITDDHALFRDGLSYVLEQIGEKIELLEASQSEQVLDHLSKNPDIDLVLLDLYLPQKDGFAILDRINREYPLVPVAFISGSKEPRDITRALDAGAVGYIPKDTSSEVTLSAIKLILSGGIYIPACMMEQQNKKQKPAGGFALTSRQTQVLGLILQGHANKWIASELKLSEATVKMHVSSIFKALGVRNRTQAVLAAKKLGLEITVDCS